MAIDFAKGIATQVATTALTKVAGNLPGLLGFNKGKGSDSSDLSFQNKKSATTPNLFQFPLDATQGPGLGNHGHYVIFFINEQQKAKLSFSGGGNDGGKLINRELNERGIPSYIKESFGGQGGYRTKKNTNAVNQILDTGTKGGVTESVGSVGASAAQQLQFAKMGGGSLNPAGGSKQKTDSRTKEDTDDTEKAEGGFVKVARPPVKRLDTAIALYMPNQVQATYGSKFLDSEIGAFAGMAGELYADIRAGKSLSDIYSNAVGNFGEGTGKKLFTSVMGAIDSFGVTGARAAIEVASGEIFADRMELAFKGVDRRSFQYTFKMIPKNQKEADEIRKIVFAFKANMLPELLQGKDRDTMLVPNTFNIQYMYKGKENDYIHRIGESFLENVQVTYGGDRYKTFDPGEAVKDGAPPVETTITLAFKEIEIITRERVFQGF